MTNEQKIRSELSTTEGLAEYLVIYNDYYGYFYTSDGTACDTKYEAIRHEVDWLCSESDIQNNIL